MDVFFPLVGPWFWWIVAAILLAGELMLPGVFLVWLAGAAALTGLADLAFALDWRMELAVFAALSVVLVALSWRWVMTHRRPVTDQPNLNRRIDACVGRRVQLTRAIANGVGQVRIDDALWEVEGPDMPRDTLVRIVGVSGTRLVAEKVS